MNCKSRLPTALLSRCAGPVLLTAVLMSGCNGSDASPTGGTNAGGTSPGSGGATTGSGGATTGSGGTTAGFGGATASTGGNSSGGATTGTGGAGGAAGGTTTSAGGSALSTGGVTTRSGGTTTSTGGATTNAGGATTNAGGATTRSGGTTSSVGGSTISAGSSAGGTTPSSGGTTSRTGGTTTSAGGATSATGGNTGTVTMPGWGTPVTGAPSGTGTTATVTVNLSSTVGAIGPDFTGFSYEKTHIMNGSLTTNNTNMIALYKLLGSPMMRLGANDVEVCTWVGTGTAPSQPNGSPFNTKVTTGGVDQLCGFLAATGSKIIYGVNFQLGDVTASAAEAAYVMGKCPSSIFAFEIGNELDKSGTWSSHQAQYEKFATAILATPGALLAGPASTSGSAASFSAPFADSESAKFGSKLALLTQHSYVAGAGSTDATLLNLQTTTSKLTDIFTTMQGAATKNKIANGYRMGENNTFSGHGQQGLSDTLIAGLWAIDYMFDVAKRGGSGVNFHSAENGMDGGKPFFYEPIKETNGAVVQVQPEYYGMLLFTQAGAGSMVSTTVTTSAQYFTAWAIKSDGFTSVVLNNRNASGGVSATVNLGAAVSSASAIYLEGTPAGTLTAAEGNVTLAGAKVSAAGGWPRNPPYSLTTSGNNISVYVPPASAALVRVLQ